MMFLYNGYSYIGTLVLEHNFSHESRDLEGQKAPVFALPLTSSSMMLLAEEDKPKPQAQVGYASDGPRAEIRGLVVLVVT